MRLSHDSLKLCCNFRMEPLSQGLFWLHSTLNIYSIHPSLPPQGWVTRSPGPVPGPKAAQSLHQMSTHVTQLKQLCVWSGPVGSERSARRLFPRCSCWGVWGRWTWPLPSAFRVPGGGGGGGALASASDLAPGPCTRRGGGFTAWFCLCPYNRCHACRARDLWLISMYRKGLI